MKILRKSKTRHIYLVQKVLLQGELSYYIKKALPNLRVPLCVSLIRRFHLNQMQIPLHFLL